MGLDITGIGSIFDFGSKIIDKIFPDKTQADQAKAALAMAQVQGQLQDEQNQWDNAKAQIGVNQVEAASESFWVAGARPFIMWICGCSLAYASILYPLIQYIHDPSHPPVIDTNLTQQILFGLLGLGAMRSYDKRQAK